MPTDGCSSAGGMHRFLPSLVQRDLFFRIRSLFEVKQGMIFHNPGFLGASWVSLGRVHACQSTEEERELDQIGRALSQLSME